MCNPCARTYVTYVPSLYRGKRGGEPPLFWKPSEGGAVGIAAQTKTKGPMRDFVHEAGSRGEGYSPLPFIDPVSLANSRS